MLSTMIGSKGRSRRYSESFCNVVMNVYTEKNKFEETAKNKKTLKRAKVMSNNKAY